MRFGRWGTLEAWTQYKFRNYATMKHIQTPPKVNSLTNKLPTGGQQANDNETWLQLGIPLAGVLSNCARAYLERVEREKEAVNDAS
jgi:hypothetical protein